MSNTELKLNGVTVLSENNGNITLDVNQLTGATFGELNFNSTNHQFTLKGVDAPIVGANYSTNDDANSGQLAIYNGATKLWGINQNGIVSNPLRPICMLYDHTNTALTAGVAAYPFNGRQIDTHNCYDISDTNNPTFTAPVDGYYFISMNSRVYYDYVGSIIGRPLINGSDRMTLYFDYFAGAASQDFQEASGTAVVKMYAGDSLKLSVIANATTNHLGFGTTGISETDSIGNSASHANIIFLG